MKPKKNSEGEKYEQKNGFRLFQFYFDIFFFRMLGRENVNAQLRVFIRFYNKTAKQIQAKRTKKKNIHK